MTELKICYHLFKVIEIIFVNKGGKVKKIMISMIGLILFSVFVYCQDKKETKKEYSSAYMLGVAINKKYIGV